MRMVATHYIGKAQPALAKKVRAETKHVLPPLKGLSQVTKSGSMDPETAIILSNFNIEEENISVRAGYQKTANRGTKPVECLVPWYGVPNAMAAASNNELWNAQNGNRIKGGFTSNDWHYTSFSNLGEYDYTVMVNGADGVWSWNGKLTDDLYGDIPATNLTSAAQAIVTVGAGDIAKFTVGQIVAVTGAVGTGTVKANGYRTILVKSGNNLTLNVDTSGGATQATGVKLNPTSGILKEDITANETWVQPATFNIVVSHMNRLFFADKANLAFYYLPIQSKSGVVKAFPLNALFRRGGTIRAMHTWTIDGGAGTNDLLVIFSTNGECVIYSGTDPNSDFKHEGIFRFDSPMSKNSVVQYGGELWVHVSTGLVPLSTMLRSETEQLGQSEKNVTTLFLKQATRTRLDRGWQTFFDPSTGRLTCNMPLGAPDRYRQLVRHMAKAVWTEWNDIPARCWSWLDPDVYFGDDKGNVYVMNPSHLNDNGKPIKVDVQMAWNNFKTPSQKRFLALQTYMSSNGTPRPIIDINVDYSKLKPVNTPDLSQTQEGGSWNTAVWNVDYWAGGEQAQTIWNGVSGLGRVGAIRLTMDVQNTTFSINGWDVVFEAGTFI